MLRFIPFFREAKMNAKDKKQDPVARSQQLLAKVRHRQLETARTGDVSASARYANRAKIVIRAADATDPQSRLAS